MQGIAWNILISPEKSQLSRLHPHDGNDIWKHDLTVQIRVLHVTASERKGTCIRFWLYTSGRGLTLEFHANYCRRQLVQGCIWPTLIGGLRWGCRHLHEDCAQTPRSGIQIPRKRGLNSSCLQTPLKRAVQMVLCKLIWKVSRKGIAFRQREF